MSALRQPKPGLAKRVLSVSSLTRNGSYGLRLGAYEYPAVRATNCSMAVAIDSGASNIENWVRDGNL